MINCFEERKSKILEFINSEEYKIMTVKQIAVIFGVPKEDIKELEKIVLKLEEEGKVYVDDSKRICIPNSSRLVCRYEAKSKGFGFARVISTNQISDIYISKENVNGAFDDDIVLVACIAPKENGKSIEGKIIKILKRGEAKFVGKVQKNDSFGFVQVIDSYINDIYIPYKLLRGVENNDRVVVKITKYPTENRKAEGKIIEILGHESDDNIEEKTILASYGIKEKFSTAVINEAENLVKNASFETEGRIDLRNKRIYTIDGDDARDLDDAICVEKISPTEYKLSVHIADVSYYVKPGSELDKEAIKRGTSIYTPDRVIPMLPRSLSNGICSLTEGDTRYTLTVEMIIDLNGNVISHSIYKSIIATKKQMTYHKVEEVLNETNTETLKEYAPFKQDILLMKELYEVISRKREAAGSLNFDIPETYFKLDRNGEPIEVMPYEIGVSNKIIEEFMLITNKTVAKKFNEINAPFIYRIHERPDVEKLRDLNELFKNMGGAIKGINNIHPKALADALDTFKEEPKKYFIASKMLLRSLKLAKYSDVCMGHFGLNFKKYCHFTSPIRRYPDLFIHRVISKYIEMDYSLDNKEYLKLKEKSIKYALTSSDAEKTATEIERDFDSLFMAKYMLKHLGDEYVGIISSVTGFGFYVKLDNTIEGLVSLSNLQDDYYIFNEKTMVLIGERTGRRFEVGQKVNVKVIRSDISLKQIDFILGE